MLFLLLIYYINQGTFTASHPIDGDPFPSSITARDLHSSCPDGDNCRTAWNIVWSCLATIFSCTWVAVHPNIPGPFNTREMSLMQRLRHALWQFLSNRLLLFVIALLVPEYILAWAIRQHLEAHRIAREHKDSNWTVTHGFFVIMGGFHLFEPPSGTPEETGQLLQPSAVDAPNLNPTMSRTQSNQSWCKPMHDPHENQNPICMLTEEELFFSSEDYQFIVPTEDEIKDRGKSDWLAKSFVLIQTAWFLTQCIARGIQHLAITELEIVTGAYAMMNFAIYFFWWKKPLNVGCPVRVTGGQDAGPQRTRTTPKWWQNDWREWLNAIIIAIPGRQDQDLDSEQIPQAPMFWSNNPDLAIVARADVITLLVGLLFGAIHCVAWSFPFPSHTEVILWRISCAVMIAVPVYVSIVGLLYIEAERSNSIVNKLLQKLGIPLVLGVIFGGFLYVFARAVTLTLAFTALRSLPPTAYVTVQWTTFIPHV
ncbi:hypothetical protein K438DRAFT_1847880 [Mycena galopus ATCC 62051]|nr:hypothetical protein K438DRAFT_1847880 [Mycena galopus ATCC 62051]